MDTTSDIFMEEIYKEDLAKRFQNHRANHENYPPQLWSEAADACMAYGWDIPATASYFGVNSVALKAKILPRRLAKEMHTIDMHSVGARDRLILKRLQWLSQNPTGYKEFPVEFQNDFATAVLRDKVSRSFIAKALDIPVKEYEQWIENAQAQQVKKTENLFGEDSDEEPEPEPTVTQVVFSEEEIGRAITSSSVTVSHAVTTVLCICANGHVVTVPTSSDLTINDVKDRLNVTA
jgi:hypothetical protein